MYKSESLFVTQWLDGSIIVITSSLPDMADFFLSCNYFCHWDARFLEKQTSWVYIRSSFYVQ